MGTLPDPQCLQQSIDVMRVHVQGGAKRRALPRWLM
jgi:hypothetical protein